MERTTESQPKLVLSRSGSNSKDGLIVSVYRWYYSSLHPNERAKVVAEVIDNEQYGKWVHLVFEFDGVKQMLIIEGNDALTVIGFPFRIGFFDGLIYIDFAPQYEVRHSAADFRQSKLMVAAKTCSWSLDPIPGYDDSPASRCMDIIPRAWAIS